MPTLLTRPHRGLDPARWIGRGLSFVLAALVGSIVGFGGAATARAALPPGNAVSDPSALLRNALPIPPGDLQDLQHRLEATSDELRAKRWSALTSTVRRSQSLLTSRRGALLNAFTAADQAEAETLLDQLELQLRDLSTASETQNRDAFLEARRVALGTIGTAEALLVGPFPFEIPTEFAALPRLLGRATVRLTTTKGDLTAVVDGYNAPITAGAFVDLVQRGFYDGLPFNRAEDFYVLQTGDPPGPADGFIDPVSQTQRRVPLEIRVPGEEQPFYNQTFEDLGMFKATAVLPFATKGTLGWAHSDGALDDGSSQFFLFLFEAELTPAGLNLIDGRYAAFGYVVDGFEVLEELTAEDGIVKATVLEGAENLRPHG
ncbi:peptidylprolyl isomerase [Synechococcus sp. Tobar12-5m-g]|uniref:peptidylprolyl isomerase n=1 Tax=unclassified Synechococcus TaxID=2626047 RepID=UPI0020CC4E5E|nr:MULTISPECIES: peptidylprolyl isomerase [unclassified Synechococcus]MCP9772383.1 peptidylprolyl isomerase [Synechococcus sp. Tobar12-5m-g]MCP9873970.1 peptidylprolyl isomerase [Synechococcus sp. Cruz CV-v-12]